MSTAMQMAMRNGIAFRARQHTENGGEQYIAANDSSVLINSGVTFTNALYRTLVVPGGTRGIAVGSVSDGAGGTEAYYDGAYGEFSSRLNNPDVPRDILLVRQSATPWSLPAMRGAAQFLAVFK